MFWKIILVANEPAVNHDKGISYSGKMIKHVSSDNDTFLGQLRLRLRFRLK